MRRIADGLLVGVFVALVAGGAAGSLRNIVRDRGGRHALAEVDWKKFPSRFETFFNDHLAARAALVAARSRVWLDWLHTSPTPRVWAGRDGWLFYNHHAEPNFYPPDDPALPTQFDAWAADLSARRARLAARGIPYLVVFAPNKQSVYPELLPRAVRSIRSASLDGLLVRCRRDPDLHILDLRGPLWAAKAQRQVYHRHDSHWNQEGAYVAYAETVRALAAWFPRLAPCPRERFTVDGRRRLVGDQARLLGLSDRFEEEPWLFPPDPRPRWLAEAVPTTAQSLPHVPTAVTVQDRSDLPRGLLLCDSFGEFLSAWLPDHFARLVSLGTYDFDPELIARERPDVVIQLFAERQLDARGTHKRSPAAGGPDAGVTSASRPFSRTGTARPPR